MPQRSRRPVALDGANELSFRGFVWVVRNWPSLRNEMTSSDGYLAHHYYFIFPFTLGLVTFWKDEVSAYRFAHKPVHMKYWKWAEGNRNSKGGWLATYEYRSGGVLWGNGVRKVRRVFEPVFDQSGDKPEPE